MDTKTLVILSIILVAATTVTGLKIIDARSFLEVVFAVLAIVGHGKVTGTLTDALAASQPAPAAPLAAAPATATPLATPAS